MKNRKILDKRNHIHPRIDSTQPPTKAFSGILLYNQAVAYSLKPPSLFFVQVGALGYHFFTILHQNASPIIQTLP